MDSSKARLDKRTDPLIPSDVVRATQIISATLLVTGTLYLCSSLFIPIVIAVLAYLSLRPVVCQLCARGLHQVIASGLVIAGMFLSVGIFARFDATYPLAVILGAEPLVEPEEDPIQVDEPIAACA